MKKFFDDYKELLVIIVGAFVGIWLIKYGWGQLSLPSASAMIDFVTNLFQEYGLIIVFLAALIESILLVGGYFPGTLIIFLSFSVAGGNLQQIATTVFTATAGMIVGYCIDYFLGKKGVVKIIHKIKLDKEVAKLKTEIDKQGVWAGFFLYILPGFGSLISTTFGILNFNFQKFFGFILITTLIWNSIWGAAGYMFGDEVLKIVESGYFGFIFLTIFIIFFVASGKYAELKKAIQ